MVVTVRGRRKGNLVLWCFFRRLFVTGGRGRSCFTLSWWQVQHFGHGGDRRGAQIS